MCVSNCHHIHHVCVTHDTNGAQPRREGCGARPACIQPAIMSSPQGDGTQCVGHVTPGVFLAAPHLRTFRRPRSLFIVVVNIVTCHHPPPPTQLFKLAKIFLVGVVTDHPVSHDHDHPRCDHHHRDACTRRVGRVRCNPTCPTHRFEPTVSSSSASVGFGCPAWIHVGCTRSARTAQCAACVERVQDVECMTRRNGGGEGTTSRFKNRQGVYPPTPTTILQKGSVETQKGIGSTS